MACDINPSEFELHMYEGHLDNAESCWGNPNVYLVKPTAAGTPSTIKVENPVTGENYFFAAKVTCNDKPASKVTQMQFGAPSWMEDGSTEIKSIEFDNKGIGSPASYNRIYHSKDPIAFLHQGDYEIYAQIKSWEGMPDEQLQSDWPKKGPLYARNSVFVTKS